MANHFDSVLKIMVRKSPRDWVRGFGLPVSGPVKLITPEIPKVSARRADAVLRIGGPQPWAHHIEFLANPMRHGPIGLLDYTVGIHWAEKVPVHSTVLLLRPEADDGTLTGEYRFIAPSGLGHVFRYQVVRVWEHSYREYLNGPKALCPLAVITDDALGDPEGIIRKVGKRVPEARANAMVLASVLAALRHKNDVLNQLWGGIHHMEESPLYQMILNEGKKRGIAVGEKRGIAVGEKRGIAVGEKRGIAVGEKRGIAVGEKKGLELGALQAKRDTVLRQGTRKWGAPNRSVRATIQGIKSTDRLDRLIDVILDATSWSDLLKR